MPDMITTSTEVDPAVAIFYDRVLLRSYQPKAIHLNFAQHASMPKKSGTIRKWRRYANLSVATTPLTETMDPPGQKLSKTDLTVAMQWFGDFVHLTDVVDLTVEDDVLAIAADKLGKQEGLTFDTLMRDILVACASITNASGGSNGNTPTELTRADMDSVTTTLVGADAQMMASPIKANSGVGTAPVPDAFWAIGHTDLIPDIEGATGFQAVHEYPRQDAHPAEWGRVGRARMMVTSNGHKWDTTTDQYWIPVLAEDAYGDVALLGKHQVKNDGTHLTTENIVKGFASGGVANPLNRRATSGWKAVWAGRILNDLYMHVLKVTLGT